MFPNTCHCCLHSMNPISTFYMIAANFNYFFNHFNIHLLYLCFDPLSSRNQFRLILIRLIPLQTPCIPRMKQRIKTDIETAYMQIWGTRTSICVLFEVIILLRRFLERITVKAPLMKHSNDNHFSQLCFHYAQTTRDRAGTTKQATIIIPDRSRLQNWYDIHAGFVIWLNTCLIACFMSLFISLYDYIVTH